MITGRPDGTDPNGFSQRLAARYLELLPTTNAPARVIAQEAGVPVATVHRWALEARRRGHLPPTRQGTARGSTAIERVAEDIGVSVDRLRESLRRHAKGGVKP